MKFVFSSLIFIGIEFSDFGCQSSSLNFLYFYFCVGRHLQKGKGTVGLCEIEHRNLAIKYRDMLFTDELTKHNPDILSVQLPCYV
jgi:hypothetical protein